MAYQMLAGAGFCLLAVALIRAFQGSTAGVSPARGRAFLQGCLLGGAGILLLSFVGLVSILRTPLYQAEGVVKSARTHPGSKSSHTDLVVHCSDGNEIALYADGLSRYFHPGEHLRVRYRGRSGFILHATFLSQDGEGQIFQSGDTWPLYLSSAAGIFVIVAGWIKYQRDPEGAERPQRENASDTAVDEASLLHLSDVSRDD